VVELSSDSVQVVGFCDDKTIITGNFFEQLNYCQLRKESCTIGMLFLPNELTTWSIVIEKLTVTQLLKKFPAICGTQGFITMFTRALHCPYPEPDVSIPHLPVLFL
jgi:hypothetical protein